ncbi:MAG: hypothetical protein RL711_500 [Bacteroidota bacterium]|jgi:hypothetical protein
MYIETTFFVTIKNINMSLELNALELAILNEISEGKYATIKTHVLNLGVRSRDKTKVGTIVNFNYLQETAPLTKEGDLLEALLSAEKTVVLPGLKNGLGYVLDISEGKLDYLEIYTNTEEKWDGSFDGFSFVEKNNK